jgi:hypothetical protein
MRKLLKTVIGMWFFSRSGFKGSGFKGSGFKGSGFKGSGFKGSEVQGLTQGFGCHVSGVSKRHS